ncbi:MAG TPA: hypothetical protein VMK42_01915 [Anaeromyxobacteraceae bacterium]|nr:hypothetical protein [Anaeromyxobacteraceae bacterium]
MASPSRILAASLFLFSARTAAAQYYYPRPPPPPPPPPPVYYPAPQPSPPARDNAFRISGGIAFVSAGYYCGYSPGYVYPCGGGYATVLPIVNADLDLALSRASAVTVGADVTWGSYNSVSTTVWEPHLDYLVLFRGSPYATARPRLRLGAGLYIATISSSGYASSTQTGGAARIGGGVSFLPQSPVGLGLDVVFEVGGLNGSFVSTLQLLFGPEIRF